LYGKIYPSLYRGSMIGAGPVAFALWPYIITNARPDDGSLIDLNPELISAIIGCKPSEIQSAIDFLCAPDDRSRTPTSNGCRLIKRSPLTYFVVNLEQYRFLDDCDDRREYWRDQKEKQRKKRQGKRGNSKLVPDSSGTFPEKSGLSHLSPNADADADADANRSTKAEADKKTKRETRSLFVKPTIEQVLLNSSKIGLPDSEAHKFFSYYVSNGWRVGRVGMRSWEAAMINWRSKWQEYGKPNKTNAGTNQGRDGAGSPVDYSNGF
jgi:hypothetical protein